MTEKEFLDIRRRFPILERKVAGRDMVYLDNAATSQTPDSVVDEIAYLYRHTKANVHRGVHTVSQEATDLQEDAGCLGVGGDYGYEPECFFHGY